MTLKVSRLDKTLYAWVEHPILDIVAAGGIAAGVTGLSAWQEWGQIIASADAGARRAVFQVVATTSGTMLGLTLTSLSILVGLIRSPVAQLEQVLPGNRTIRMARTFVSALLALGAVFMLAVWAILNNTKDGTPGSTLVQAMILAALVLAALRIYRVVWILWKMLQITSAGTATRT